MWLLFVLWRPRDEDTKQPWWWLFARQLCGEKRASLRGRQHGVASAHLLSKTWFVHVQERSEWGRGVEHIDVTAVKCGPSNCAFQQQSFEDASFCGAQFEFCVTSITLPFCFNRTLKRKSFMGDLSETFSLTHKFNPSSFSLTDKNPTHLADTNLRRRHPPFHRQYYKPSNSPDRSDLRETKRGSVIWDGEVKWLSIFSSGQQRH